MSSDSDAFLRNRCAVINDLRINADMPSDDLNSLLYRRGIKPPTLTAVIDAIKAWPLQKKEKRKAKILDNPNDHALIRPVEDNQVAALHLITRNAIFQVVGDKDRRAKYSEKSSISDELIDKLVNREFIGWGGQIHFIIKGPVLCTFDQQVFYSCLRIHHVRGFRGLQIETTLSDIWRAMGRSCHIGSSSLSALKRSLTRLADVSIKASPLNEHKGSFWLGGLFDEVLYLEGKNPKQSRVHIRLNSHFVPQYLSGSYCTLFHPHIISLRAYASRLYEFLVSHDDPIRRMGLDKWREVLGVGEEVPDKTFKQRLKEAVDDLIKARILLSESGFQGVLTKSVLVTHLTDSAKVARAEA
jgi:hypothetical protein